MDRGKFYLKAGTRRIFGNTGSGLFDVRSTGCKEFELVMTGKKSQDESAGTSPLVTGGFGPAHLPHSLSPMYGQYGFSGNVGARYSMMAY